MRSILIFEPDPIDFSQLSSSEPPAEHSTCGACPERSRRVGHSCPTPLTLPFAEINDDCRMVEHTHPDAGIRTGVKARFAELVQVGRKFLVAHESVVPARLPKPTNEESNLRFQVVRLPGLGKKQLALTRAGQAQHARSALSCNNPSHDGHAKSTAWNGSIASPVAGSPRRNQPHMPREQLSAPLR